jgi:hypothetical protein
MAEQIPTVEREQSWALDKATADGTDAYFGAFQEHAGLWSEAIGAVRPPASVVAFAPRK